MWSKVSFFPSFSFSHCPHFVLSLLQKYLVITQYFQVKKPKVEHYNTHLYRLYGLLFWNQLAYGTFTKFTQSFFFFLTFHSINLFLVASRRCFTFFAHFSFVSSENLHELIWLSFILWYIFGNSIRLVNADCIVSVCQAKRKMRQEQMRYIENIKLIDSTTNLNSFEFNVRLFRFVNALYVFCFWIELWWEDHSAN